MGGRWIALWGLEEMKQEYKKLVAKVIKSNPIKPAGKARKSSRTIGQESQRYRTTKTGAKTKKPSARLLQRRSRDNVPGYYPNPAKRVYAVQQSQYPGKVNTKNEWINLGIGSNKENAEKLAKAIYKANPSFSVRVKIIGLPSYK